MASDVIELFYLYELTAFVECMNTQFVSCTCIAYHVT